MLTWSGMKRSADVVLAVWPFYRPLHNRWYLQELIEKDENAPAWRERLVPGENDSVRSDHYPDQPAALAAARALNPILRAGFESRGQDPTTLRSLQLKVDKALGAKERLQEEEALMLREAERRHAGEGPPDPALLLMAPQSEPFREELAEQLAQRPYLKVARLSRAHPRRNPVVLYLGPSGEWSKPLPANERLAQIAERAKIANGFDLDATAHWGKVKAEIRQILLPRANQLLKLASVQRLLAEALARGERVLVSNGIVFWYEAEGGIGWQIKSTTVSQDSQGTTIWREGTILSTNHGRLVVLPYIKDNGEQVRGHTKNAPHDGRAMPRHPDHFVEIPFSLYEGDLMIGLFGELPYE